MAEFFARRSRVNPGFFDDAVSTAVSWIFVERRLASTRRLSSLKIQPSFDLVLIDE